MIANGPTEARFVSVTVRPVALRTIFPTAIFGGQDAVSTGASAVAGFDQVVCGVTPIYVCNPYEASGMSYEQATQALYSAANDPTAQRRLIRLREYPGGDAQYFAGDYGFLIAPTIGSDVSCCNQGHRYGASAGMLHPARCQFKARLTWSLLARHSTSGSTSMKET